MGRSLVASRVHLCLMRHGRVPRIVDEHLDSSNNQLLMARRRKQVLVQLLLTTAVARRNLCPKCCLGGCLQGRPKLALKRKAILMSRRMMWRRPFFLASRHRCRLTPTWLRRFQLLARLFQGVLGTMLALQLRLVICVLLSTIHSRGSQFPPPFGY